MHDLSKQPQNFCLNLGFLACVSHADGNANIFLVGLMNTRHLLGTGLK